MATSAPPPNVTSGWTASQNSTNVGPSNSSLELGMSGMSLMASFGGVSEGNEDLHQEPRKMASSGDSVHSHRSSNASPLPSGPPGKNIGRPPGLGSSPIDGASDLYSMGRQSSPFQGDGRSISSDYSRRKDDGSDYPLGMTNFGSYDGDDGEHDGLLGLQALRDRTHSSPGPMNATPYSSSPPVRGQIGSFDDVRNLLPDQRRPRAVSRDGGRAQSVGARPPLSGGAGLSPHTVEKTYQPPGYSSGSRSRDPSPPHYTQEDPRAPGIISRPGYPGGDVMTFDAARRRSISTDTGREFVNPYSQTGEPGHHSIDQLSHKFGQLPSLSSHVNQQRMQQQNLGPAQHAFQRHQRSASQPGPMRGSGVQPEYYPEEVYHRRGNDYGVGMPPNHGEYIDPRYNSHQSQNHGHHTRSLPDHMGRNNISMSQGSNSSTGSVDSGPIYHPHRRSSLQNMPTSNSGGFYGQSHGGVLRRESLDFVPGHRYSEGTPIVATSEELKMFSGSESDRITGNYGRQERMVSPAHSPLHVNYGSHARHPSDMGSSAMSSSPMSLGSAGVRAIHGHEPYGGSSHGGSSRGGRHRMTPSDDDLSHPLLGENIEVPGDDAGYIVNEGVPAHTRVHGHSGQAEQVPNHYQMEGQHYNHHHPPTAGAALPMPKVVYNIKFKRTQRNFAIGPRLNRDLKIGTYVKVEADRGEDLGIVIGKVPTEKYNVSTRPPFRGAPGGNEMGIMPPPSGLPAAGAADLKRIIRLATHDEVGLLALKREEEEELLKICRTKVRQRNLPMNVVDAEYQFDRHKLTFFFEAEGRVDFRELVRDLFSMYKTRIWMQQLDKNTAATCPTGATPTEPLVMDYGTPIIAPESEYQEFTHTGSTHSENETN